LRAQWAWLALLGVLMLLGFWWFPGRGGADSDTYGTGVRGKKAFYRLVDELNGGVSRNINFLVPALGAMGTLVLLGPARYPESSEWEAIYDWLLDGGRLVFAARSDAPAVDIGPLGVEIRAVDGGEESPTEAETVEDVAIALFGVEDSSCSESVDTALADGGFCWSSTGTIQYQDAGAEVLLSVEGKPQVIFLRVGKGVAVVAASDRIFTNSELARKRYDNDLLAYRILASCETLEPIYFDESLNAMGTPKAFGILFDPMLRRLSLQLCLCAVLFAWWGSRRFGPPKPPADPSHRSIREHAVAMGNLHFKAGSGSEVASHYLEFFRRELGLHAGSLRGRVPEGGHTEHSRPAELLARWAGIEASTVAKTLEEADRAERGERFSSSETAWLIGSLARIKRRISKGKGLNETDHGA